MSNNVDPGIGDQVLVDGQGLGVIQDISGSEAIIVLESGGTITASLDDISTDPPYLSFECNQEHGGCGNMLVLESALGPGQAGVLACGNCGESWTVYQPPLEVHRTDAFERVWPFIAQ